MDAHNALIASERARGAAVADDFVLLLDHRALDRDCLARSLTACDPGLDIVAAGTLEDWLATEDDRVPTVIVLVISGLPTRESRNCELFHTISTTLPDSPLIVVADTDDLGYMLKALENGARGFIPRSVSIDIAIEAIRLARAGGVFLPASGILAMRGPIENVMKDTCGPGSIFTPREVEVTEALRRGKANKVIGYELNMCESTVKVHIRNIMKKLHATNRTEVAYKLREMTQHSG